MACYVDDMKAPFRRMVMCHMFADTREELFAMADRIGVARKWFQRPDAAGVEGMAASWEHFDISMSKRALAVKYGAIETDKYGPLEHLARLRILSGDFAALERFERIGRLRNGRHG
jgi:hypothetical protein